MTQEGLNHIRDLVSADITNGTLGTDGTAATSSDTDLGAADATTNLAVTKTTTNRQIKFDYSLASTGGTTGTYREFKLNSATDDFDHTVFSGISWTANGSEQIAITKKYFFRGT